MTGSESEVAHFMGENTIVDQQNPSFADLVAARLEALKLVKDWSAGLIVVQSGAIAVVGAFLQAMPSGWRLWLVAGLLIALIASIYIGAVAVMGTVPYIVQNLPQNANADIYGLAGGIKKSRFPLAHLTLGKLCLWQARLFTISLILFAIFAVTRESSNTAVTHMVIDQPIKISTPVAQQP